MNRQSKTIQNRAQRKNRVRATVIGTADRPRLSVFISNRHVVAQVIDDDAHSTLAYATTVGSKDAKGTKTEQAAWIGEQIAKSAKAAKVSRVVLDRGSKLYHGRVAALADAARKSGLEF
jgi:large subunit ribosomal protein L18